jgi:putative membrane protein
MKETQINRWIFLISIAVPLLVAVLFFTPAIHININLSLLPKINAYINATVSILLVMGIYFIKNNKRKEHKICMLTAFSLSALFLISYVVYHAGTEDTKYGDANHDGMVSEAEAMLVSGVKYVYYFILITHILLAAVILPFILITVSRALSERFDKHRRIAKITFPIWLYVSVTGVVIYLMIAQYYP